MSITRKFGPTDGTTYLRAKLRERGWVINEKPADLAVQRERIREAIVLCGLADVVVGHSSGGRPESYQQAFERHYNQPLQPQQATTSKEKLT